ncbi:anti-sigma regulatory factor (Ser/Thr protein kinase) [Streptomyces sp. SAI-149]|nr:anti-sigma regulatory factor (Ser/Thr protein kinase) [Streptomyces sp. SAI-149]
MASDPPVGFPLYKLFPLWIPLAGCLIARCDRSMTFRKAFNHEDGRGCCDQRAQAGSERAAIRDFEVAFAPADAHVRLMRRITLAHLRLWGLTALNDTVTLAVSELVTNAVRHCHGSEIGLRIVSSAEELRIEVTDGNPTPAQRREVDAEAENGRGLWLVAALAKEWGVSSDGTMTWCCLALPPADARAVEAPMVHTTEPESRRSVGTGERPAPAPKTDRTLLSVGTP